MVDVQKYRRIHVDDKIRLLMKEDNAALFIDEQQIFIEQLLAKVQFKRTVETQKLCTKLLTFTQGSLNTYKYMHQKYTIAETNDKVLSAGPEGYKKREK